MKISKKVAQDQLGILLDYYDYEYKELGDQEKKHADSVLRGIMKGRFEVSDKGTVKQLLKFPLGDNKSIIELDYRHMKAGDKQEMDEYPADAHNKRAQALMGVVCEKGIGTIEELEGPDMAYMEALGLLFLLL